MEGFSFVDIFDTKGIEYLVVIGFLLIIAPVWLLLNKPVKMKVDLLRSVQGLTQQILQIPQGLFYSKNHTWTFMEKSGTAKVGVDDLLLHITGGVSVDYLKKNGEKVNKGELIAVVKQEDRELKIKSPISGELEKVNAALKLKEGQINQDPYGKGWMCKIKPENWKSESSEFMMAKEAEQWVSEELLKCKDFLAETVKAETGADTVVLQEGGVIADFPLADMSADTWAKFQNEFLD